MPVGKGRKASFAACSPAIGKKNNKANRPSPRDRRAPGFCEGSLDHGKCAQDPGTFNQPHVRDGQGS